MLVSGFVPTSSPLQIGQLCPCALPLHHSEDRTTKLQAAPDKMQRYLKWCAATSVKPVVTFGQRSEGLNQLISAVQLPVSGLTAWGEPVQICLHMLLKVLLVSRADRGLKLLDLFRSAWVSGQRSATGSCLEQISKTQQRLPQHFEPHGMIWYVVAVTLTLNSAVRTSCSRTF